MKIQKDTDLYSILDINIHCVYVLKMYVSQSYSSSFILSYNEKLPRVMNSSLVSHRDSWAFLLIVILGQKLNIINILLILS